MKTLRIALAFMALTVLGQAATSTITGTVNYGDGHAVTGKLTISWPSFTGSDGYVPPGHVTVPITASHYTVALRPNTASGVDYLAEFFLSSEGGATWTERWRVSISTTDPDSARTATTQGYNPQTGSMGPMGPQGPPGVSWMNDPTLRPIFGEVPTKTGTYTYSMAAVALAPGYACYYNGLRMKLGVDFTVTGNVLTAGHMGDGTSYWQTDDTQNYLQCDYTYVVTH